MGGGSTFFYCAVKDGTVHEIGNLGNTYLVIDGKYYKADYEWLASWEDVFPEGDQALPEGYLEQPQPGQPQRGAARGRAGRGEPAVGCLLGRFWRRDA